MSKLKYYDGTEWKTVNGQITGDTLPIGSQIPYGSTTAPANWLVCDGSYVSKTTYSELYAVIGDSYLDGGTAPEGTFRLPNKKGRNSIGYDPNDTDYNSIGKTGGEKKHTLTVNEMPSHFHSGIKVAQNYLGSWNEDGVGNTFNLENLFTQSKKEQNKFVTEETGGGQAHNIVSPFEVDCWIIKAKQSSGLIANVSNTQSNSQTDTYSCDYINDIVSWKLLGTATGDTSFTLPNDFNEIYIESEINSSVSCLTIPKQSFTSAKYFVGGGYYIPGGENKTCTWYATSTSIKLNACLLNGNDVKSGTTTKVYYR